MGNLKVLIIESSTVDGLATSSIADCEISSLALWSQKGWRELREEECEQVSAVRTHEMSVKTTYHESLYRKEYKDDVSSCIVKTDDTLKAERKGSYLE